MAWYRPTLDRLSNVAFIAMCLVVTAVGLQRFSAPAPAGDARAPAAPFKPGTKLALPEALQPAGARGSIVLALSTKCQYCTASMPLYSRLNALEAVTSGRMKLSVISLQPEDQMRAYLAAHNVTVDRVVPFPDADVSIRGTPTLILTDRYGAVVNSWAGQLRQDEEDELVKALNRIAGS